MKLGALSLLLGAMTAQGATGQTPTTPSEPFLLLTSELHTTYKPTAGPNTVGNCMIVYPDGRLHLELRRQEFFYGPASIVSYEGNLPPEELTSLRSILDSDAVRSLQAVQPPRLPLQGDDFGWFTAKNLARDKSAEGGHRYLEWLGSVRRWRKSMAGGRPCAAAAD